MSLATLSLMHLALTGTPMDLERLLEIGEPLVVKKPEPPPQPDNLPTPRNRHERRAEAARARKR